MKPLTKKERETLEAQARLDNYNDWARLFEAEAFWRNAVKNAEECSDIGPSSGMCYMCNFCGKDDDERDPPSLAGGSGHITHEPDCPWVLAQEVG